MIEDRTNGKLDLVKVFAAKVGKTDDLQKQLDYLAGYSDNETRCVLYTDFAPNSFAFDMLRRKKDDGSWEHWFNGGLLWHGTHDDFGSGAAPTLSVCLSPTDGWSVHT